jgi:hypothetical protein
VESAAKVTERKVVAQGHRELKLESKNEKMYRFVDSFLSIKRCKCVEAPWRGGEPEVNDVEGDRQCSGRKSGKSGKRK